MIELITKTLSSEMQIIDGRMRATAALSESGEVQCTSPNLGLFKLVRNDEGSVDAKFSDGSLLRVSNLRVDH